MARLPYPVEVSLAAITSGIDWGDAPTWAGVTLAAAAGATGLLIYRIESRRDREAAQAQMERLSMQMQAQAALVCAWYDFRQTVKSNPDGRGLCATARNASDLPVYDVRLRFRLVEFDRPGESRALLDLTSFLPVLPPGEDELFIQGPIEEQEKLEHPLGMPLVSMTFRDAAERKWTRHFDGTLESA